MEMLTGARPAGGAATTAKSGAADCAPAASKRTGAFRGGRNRGDARCARAHGVRFCGRCAAFPCPHLTELIFWNPDVVEHMRALAERWGGVGYDG